MAEPPSAKIESQEPRSEQLRMSAGKCKTPINLGEGYSPTLIVFSPFVNDGEGGGGVNKLRNGTRLPN
jgi:hypothetical protein